MLRFVVVLSVMPNVVMLIVVAPIVLFFNLSEALQVTTGTMVLTLSLQLKWAFCVTLGDKMILTMTQYILILPQRFLQELT